MLHLRRNVVNTLSLQWFPLLTPLFSANYLAGRLSLSGGSILDAVLPSKGVSFARCLTVCCDGCLLDVN